MMRKHKKHSTIDMIYSKYQSKQKISYEEYVILLSTNDEVWFSLEGTIYQVDHGIKGITSMFVTKYHDKQKIFERSEDFISITDLLHHFKINGKTIKEVWDKVGF